MTGGKGEPLALGSTHDPHSPSLYDRLDTFLVKATGPLGSWGLHSKHLERYRDTHKKGLQY